MEKINLSDLLEPEHMDPVKRIALIRIVDDDGGVRESYKFLIESEGWRVKTYPSAEAFLEEDDPTVPGCGVFDVRMTGITGMELHQKLIELANRLPVIFVSAHGDIEMAVSDVLGIAKRTAQVHVAHVCSKLGVENAVGVAQIIARLRARGVLQ